MSARDEGRAGDREDALATGFPATDATGSPATDAAVSPPSPAETATAVSPALPPDAASAGAPPIDARRQPWRDPAWRTTALTGLLLLAALLLALGADDDGARVASVALAVAVLPLLAALFGPAIVRGLREPTAPRTSARCRSSGCRCWRWRRSGSPATGFPGCS